MTVTTETDVTLETPVVVAPEPPAPSANALLVRAWLEDWFHNAQLPTPLQNRLADAAQNLIVRLDAAKE